MKLGSRRPGQPEADQHTGGADEPPPGEARPDGAGTGQTEPGEGAPEAERPADQPGGAGGRAAVGAHAKRREATRGHTAAGNVFARSTLLPTLVLIAWLLAGLPLLLVGGFTAPLATGIAVVLAAALIAAVFAWVPLRWPHERTPWWTVVALLAVAVAFGVWQGFMHSQQVIVRRDPAAYLQFAYWIAHHGSLPVPQFRHAFGGTAPGLGFQSPGFYARGTAVIPQFMAGAPMTLAAAFWMKGIQLAVLAPAVFGACAVLTFGGLVGRLCGPRWAPLGAVVLALSLPEQYTTRSTFSEPLAQILLLGGFCLAVDALWLTLRSPEGAADGAGGAKVGEADTGGDHAGGADDGSAVPAASQGGPARPSHEDVAGAREAGDELAEDATDDDLIDDDDAVADSGADPVPPGKSPDAKVTAGTSTTLTMPITGEAADREPGEVAGGPAAGDGGEVAGEDGDRDAAVAARLPRAQWLLAAVAGLALGLSTLVRIDGASDILPVILFCGILYATRRPGALPMAAGLAVGAAYGLADGYVLSRPYLDSLAAQMRPLGYAAAAFAAATILLVAIALRYKLPRLDSRAWRWLPDTTAVLAIGVMLAFAIRPLVQTVRGETNSVTIAFIAEVQRLTHLPIDPRRTYAEDSLYWVIWYIGLPAVLLGTFGAALLARRFLRRTALVWGLPVMVISWSVVTTLWHPGIVPDQPWASKRLVPLVIPGLVLFAVWACAWLIGRARERGGGKIAQGTAAACCAIALLLPTAVTSFGLGVARAPTGHLKIFASGLALKRTDTGEIAVVNRLCRAIGHNASVIIVDTLTADRFTQIVRGMCGTPAARVKSPGPAAVAQAAAAIQRAGRRPVLLAETATELSPYGGTPVRVVYRATRQDEHRLTQPPTTTWRILYQVWMSTPVPQSTP